MSHRQVGRVTSVLVLPPMDTLASEPDKDNGAELVLLPWGTVGLTLVARMLICQLPLLVA